MTPHPLFSTIEGAFLALLAAFHMAGAFSAVRALFTARSSQGAIAWALSMVMFPYVAVPLYWVLGRDRFVGYVTARRGGSPELHALRAGLDAKRADSALLPHETAVPAAVLERLAGMPFTAGNKADLLVNGEETFRAIFEAVAQAHDYVLVQFFIIHDDAIGRDLKDRLCAKARQGVRVMLLYDEIGCHALPEAYLEDLRHAGVDARAFNTTKGLVNRFQVNFRNHRKIVVVDGRVAFVGGHNVGDEYMGRSRRFGPWRDTHLRCEGPAAALVQLCFAEDWFWAEGGLPRLDWSLESPADGSVSLLALPSSPADLVETYTLAFLQLVQSARERLWIVSPYFVPDREVTVALQLAALRGVDVRVMLPARPDHKLVYLASFSYFPELERQGVKFYRYQPGFLHQKVVLMDRDLAFVGTANCDNRSFRLNFEITMAALGRDFADRVEAMLLEDFARCRPATASDYEDRSMAFKAMARLARLLAPIL
ncbi:putative cardiolipin synthase YwiE [Fundidesulfovibrio magnetotacticus]|uniref:Cardiolipin synthase n=1 Tax=Fundidesulfovibrio magnetotacticus TaxID=2730080 RepID=A0A6V8LMA3_9BACT|nr:cardiolipin synthase [Fundidesulfovibrio magnetotacticus]GFK92834.1 putative cardiolipin synthase YwiE [Fundidesulfovibrio magnetotacticus]